jgi:tetratricopeptide (TPR) repeat protein
VRQIRVDRWLALAGFSRRESMSKGALVVVGILNSLRHSRELSLLRKDTRTSPTPGNFVALAERCIAFGRVEEALRVARKGRQLFPDSARLSEIFGYANRRRLNTKISALRRRISEKPSPTDIGDLAEIYLEIGDDEQALRLSEDLARRFPLNERPYLLLGQIRLGRFLREMILQDGQEALSNLRRALNINPVSERAGILLAHLHFAVGDLERMRRRLERVLKASPANEGVRQFLETASPSPACDPDSDEVFEDDLPASEWISAAEARGCFVNRPETFGPSLLEELGAPSVPALAVTETAISRLLEDTASVPGVVAVAVLDRKASPLPDRNGTTNDRRLADAGSAIVRTAEEAGRRMDVGTFQWCTVEGDFGCLTVRRLPDLHLVARYGPPLRPEHAPRTLESCSDTLYAPPREVEHA